MERNRILVHLRSVMNDSEYFTKIGASVQLLRHKNTRTVSAMRWKKKAVFLKKQKEQNIPTRRGLLFSERQFLLENVHIEIIQSQTKAERKESSLNKKA